MPVTWLWIVLILGCIVGLPRFTHVTAGPTEARYVSSSPAGAGSAHTLNYLVPAFIGNSVGGIAFVAALAHAQRAPAESR